MLSFGVALNAPRKLGSMVNFDFLICRHAKKLFNYELNSYTILSDIIIKLELFE